MVNRGPHHADASVLLVDLDDIDWSDPPPPPASRVVAGRASRPLPDAAEPYLERLAFTVAPSGPGRSWIDADPDLPAVPSGPAEVLLDVLGVVPQLEVEDALVVESLAYSTLLAGHDFRTWRASTPRREVPADDEPVLVSRDGDVLRIALNRPGRHNAFDRGMRDGLVEALEIARLDPSVSSVELTGTGPTFCSGGDLDEFGSTPDVVTAHTVRLERSAALAVHRLRDRVRPVLHGTCFGAGIEVPSFAGHVTARTGTTFCLPELRLGLIPGAGGTVGITRRIGRWRTAYLALSGRPVDAGTALSWGLVDELV